MNMHDKRNLVTQQRLAAKPKRRVYERPTVAEEVMLERAALLGCGQQDEGCDPPMQTS